LEGKPEERDNYEVIDLNGRIILNWILKKYDGVFTGLIWLKIEISGELV
jgi:hypothetical protein